MLRRWLDRAVVAIRPNFPDTILEAAARQEARGETGAAAASLERAVVLRRDGGAWVDAAALGWRLARRELAQGRTERAERLTDLALRAAPDAVEALCLRCGLRMRRESLDEAEADARRATAADPSSAAAAYSLGLVLRAQARVDEALGAFSRATALAPGRFDLEPAELLMMTLSDAVSPQRAFERHRDFGRRLEAAVAPRFASWRGTREPERRLRVGFVSCDFNRHPVAWFLLPLLERVDRQRMETVCYSTGDRVDEVTAQVKAAAGAWREAAALDDDALADAIHADAIDILIDLTGYAGAFRLGVFARQSAPVQASWAGYLHSTGLTRIGWRITDARADPPGASEALHTERLARLPHALWCYRPPIEVPRPPPHGEGALAASAFTFVSPHQLGKVSPRARRLWAEILRGQPRSRLLVLGAPEGRAREDLVRDFGAAGIDAARLELRARTGLGAYYRALGECDIALDTMPYGGGTTTFDALWMGVPVLTLAGERPAGRSASSILGALGLADWVAASEAQYVRLGVSHAADRAGLARLRATLRERLRASALMDEAGFARDMESLLRTLWREECARAIP